MPAADYTYKQTPYYNSIYTLYNIYLRLVALGNTEINTPPIRSATTLKDVKYLYYIYKERKPRYIFAVNNSRK